VGSLASGAALAKIVIEVRVVGVELRITVLAYLNFELYL